MLLIDKFQRCIYALVPALYPGHAQAAQGVAVLFPYLAGAALVAGAVTGVLAGRRGQDGPRWHTGFLVFLGLTVVLTTTFAGTMDVVPLALALTALTGVLPYSAAYFGVRSGVRRWRANDDGGKGHSKAD